MSTLTAPRSARRGRTFWFLRHLTEMTIAMIVGMAAYGLLLGGLGVENARLDQPELFVLGMALSMSVTMVAWMRLGSLPVEKRVVTVG